MFNVKQKRINGKCMAMRCKEDATADLCEAHLVEWHEAGRPELSAKAPKSRAPAALALPDAIRAEIEPTRANLEEALRQVSALPLTSQDALDWMGEARKTVKTAVAWLDDQRKTRTRPLLDQKAAIDAVFKPALEQGKAVLECIDTRLNAFETERRAAQDRALVEVGQTSGSVAVDAVIALQGGGLELPDTVRKRAVLCVEIVDREQVPRAFLQLDESLALAYARERGGAACQVPGLRFYEETHVVSAPGAAGRT